jgi:hypothetical protein
MVSSFALQKVHKCVSFPMQKFKLKVINHENMQFYSFEQIQEKLETNNFLKFYILIARIPKAFKDCLKENLFTAKENVFFVQNKINKI